MSAGKKQKCDLARPLLSQSGDALETESSVEMVASEGAASAEARKPPLAMFLRFWPTTEHAHVSRAGFHQLVAGNFGNVICSGNRRRAALYNHVAKTALESTVEKRTDVVSRIWSLDDGFLQQPVNLQPRSQRGSFSCVPGIYDYQAAPEATLVTDFASARVGGGCFGHGFVQEEQMVMQSTDFAARLHMSRELIRHKQAVSYEGIHMDVWWDREACGFKEQLPYSAIQPRQSQPLTIFAVDAPNMKHKQMYDQGDLLMLARKTALIFATAEELNAPLIFSGLIGGGAYRGSRPLALLLHLLLHRDTVSIILSSGASLLLQ